MEVSILVPAVHAKRDERVRVERRQGAVSTRLARAAEGVDHAVGCGGIIKARPAPSREAEGRRRATPLVQGAGGLKGR
eukprot:15616594-Heterocapsa_arctica.AAC.1